MNMKLRKTGFEQFLLLCSHAIKLFLQWRDYKEINVCRDKEIQKRCKKMFFDALSQGIIINFQSHIFWEKDGNIS